MDWRLIFYINVPVGILGAVAAALVLPRFPRVAGRRFDVLGFVTIASGLFAVLLALSEGESWGWDSYRVLMLITYSVLSLALFVVIELQVADPLLDIRIFRHRAFTYTLLLISVLMVVMFGVLFYIPLFLQQAQGWGAFDAGLTLLPQALVMGFLMPIAGRIYDRIGPRWPAAIGLAIVAIGTYQLHTLTLDTPREHVMWLLVLQGAGLGMAMMPIFTGGIAVIPMAQVNAASAFNNVVQRVSGALGLAVLTAILTTQQAQQMAGRAALMPANTPTPRPRSDRSPGAGSVRHLPADAVAGVRRRDRRPVPDRLRSQRAGRGGGTGAAAIRIRSPDSGRLHPATAGSRAAGIPQRRGDRPAPPCPARTRQFSPTRPIPPGHIMITRAAPRLGWS